MTFRDLLHSPKLRDEKTIVTIGIGCILALFILSSNYVQIHLTSSFAAGCNSDEDAHSYGYLGGGGGSTSTTTSNPTGNSGGSGAGSYLPPTPLPTSTPTTTRSTPSTTPTLPATTTPTQPKAPAKPAPVVSGEVKVTPPAPVEESPEPSAAVAPTPDSPSPAPTLSPSSPSSPSSPTPISRMAFGGLLASVIVIAAGGAGVLLFRKYNFSLQEAIAVSLLAAVVPLGAMYLRVTYPRIFASEEELCLDPDFVARYRASTQAIIDAYEDLPPDSLAEQAARYPVLDYQDFAVPAEADVTDPTTAKAILSQVATTYGKDWDLDTLTLSDSGVQPAAESGGRVMYFQQYSNGKPVLGGSAALVLGPTGTGADVLADHYNSDPNPPTYTDGDIIHGYGFSYAEANPDRAADPTGFSAIVVQFPYLAYTGGTYAQGTSPVACADAYGVLCDSMGPDRQIAVNTLDSTAAVLDVCHGTAACVKPNTPLGTDTYYFDQYSSQDNEVAFHELAHALVDRLNPLLSRSTFPESEVVNEGASQFYALVRRTGSVSYPYGGFECVYSSNPYHCTSTAFDYSDWDVFGEYTRDHSGVSMPDLGTGLVTSYLPLQSDLDLQGESTKVTRLLLQMYKHLYEEYVTATLEAAAAQQALPDCGEEITNIEDNYPYEQWEQLYAQNDAILACQAGAAPIVEHNAEVMKPAQIAAGRMGDFELAVLQAIRDMREDVAVSDANYPLVPIFYSRVLDNIKKLSGSTAIDGDYRNLRGAGALIEQNADYFRSLIAEAGADLVVGNSLIPAESKVINWTGVCASDYAVPVYELNLSVFALNLPKSVKIEFISASGQVIETRELSVGQYSLTRPGYLSVPIALNFKDPVDLKITLTDLSDQTRTIDLKNRFGGAYFTPVDPYLCHSGSSLTVHAVSSSHPLAENSNPYASIIIPQLAAITGGAVESFAFDTIQPQSAAAFANFYENVRTVYDYFRLATDTPETSVLPHSFSSLTASPLLAITDEGEYDPDQPPVDEPEEEPEPRAPLTEEEMGSFADAIQGEIGVTAGGHDWDPCRQLRHTYGEDVVERRLKELSPQFVACATPAELTGVCTFYNAHKDYLPEDVRAKYAHEITLATDPSSEDSYTTNESNGSITYWYNTTRFGATPIRTAEYLVQDLHLQSRTHFNTRQYLIDTHRLQKEWAGGTCLNSDEARGIKVADDTRGLIKFVAGMADPSAGAEAATASFVGEIAKSVGPIARTASQLNVEVAAAFKTAAAGKKARDAIRVLVNERGTVLAKEAQVLYIRIQAAETSLGSLVSQLSEGSSSAHLAEIKHLISEIETLTGEANRLQELAAAHMNLKTAEFAVPAALRAEENAVRQAANVEPVANVVAEGPAITTVNVERVASILADRAKRLAAVGFDIFVNVASVFRTKSVNGLDKVLLKSATTPGLYDVYIPLVYARESSDTRAIVGTLIDVRGSSVPGGQALVWIKGTVGEDGKTLVNVSDIVAQVPGGNPANKYSTFVDLSDDTKFVFSQVVKQIRALF